MGKARLSMAFEQVSGRMGRETAVRSRSGTLIRARPTYRQAAHPATAAAQARLKAANAAWDTLDAAGAAAWARYARTVTRVDEVTGVHYSPAAKNAFVGLATRWLQVHPGGAVPLAPPAGPYAGDRVIVDCGTGIVEGSEGKPAGRVHNPQSPIHNGALTFTASGPNRAGTVTELMAQPLKNERCSPTGRFKSQAFAAFATGHLSADVPLAPGWYAVAYRFVDAATGQAGTVVPLGKVQVV